MADEVTRKDIDAVNKRVDALANRVETVRKQITDGFNANDKAIVADLNKAIASFDKQISSLALLRHTATEAAIAALEKRIAALE